VYNTGVGSARRRWVTLPATLVGAPVAVVAAPFLLAVAAAVDVVTLGWRRWPTVRMVAFLVHYAAIGFVGIVVSGALWLRHRVTGLGTATSQRHHWAVMRWWLGRHLAAMEALFGVRWEERELDGVAPGPVIVLCRHTALLDALYGVSVAAVAHPMKPRVVLMRELVLEPNIDVIGHRMPHYFVDRVATTGGIDAIRDMVAGMGGDEAGFIFPEGGLFRPERLRRAKEKLAESAPHRKVGELRHLMPVRPGGAMGMLDGAPDADVVVLAHVGFERLADPWTVWRNVPLRAPISTRVWRIDRSRVPGGDGERVRWLDERWQDADDWIESVLAGR
jgi:1-acyl-sn-glycerol-3-phosphate acyltransferase